MVSTVVAAAVAVVILEVVVANAVVSVDVIK